MKLLKEDFEKYSILLSMVGGSSNIENFHRLFGYKPLTFFGLNTADTIAGLSLRSDPTINQEDIAYMNKFPGTIGCHMNHFYAIYHAFVCRWDYVILIEDDVLPNSSFEVLSKSLEELPSNFECVNFGWIPSIVLRERGQIPVAYSDNLFKKDGMESSGAFGYLLSKPGIAKALSILADLRVPTDRMFKFMDTYYTKVPYFSHPPANAFSRIRH